MRGCVVERSTKSGETRFAIQYRLPSGKSVRRTIGSSRREAERALVDTLGEINAGYRQQDVRFQPFLTRYLRQCEENGLKASTLATYNYTSKRLVDYFGDAKLRDGVTVRSVQAYISHRLSQSDTPHTVNKTLWLLSGVCESAVREGVLAFNPVGRVRKPRVHRPAERTVLAPDTIADILRWVAPRHRGAITILALTAMRPSELCGLVYATDVDFRNSELIVQRTAWRGRLHAFPKQNRTRRVPFGESVRRVLEGQRESAAKSMHGTVISGRNGGIVDAKILNAAFRDACKRAGVALPAGEDTLYVLRHSACSNWLRAGVDPATAASIAGHSVRTLVATYLHGDRNKAHEAVIALDAATSRPAGAARLA